MNKYKSIVIKRNIALRITHTHTCIQTDSCPFRESKSRLIQRRNSISSGGGIEVNKDHHHLRNGDIIWKIDALYSPHKTINSKC